MSTETSVFCITQTTGFFHEVNTLLIAFQAVAVASELIVSGNCQHNPGDYITIEARHINAKVRLPLVGPIEVALTNRVPDKIEITVVSGRDKERAYAHETSGFMRFVDSVFLPFLVAYHERYKTEIELRYPGGRTTWPDAWQMSWAIRNAASHDGRVFDKPTRQAVVWRGLCFSPSDEIATSILRLVNGGDLLILMIEMEELRTGISLKHV